MHSVVADPAPASDLAAVNNEDEERKKNQTISLGQIKPHEVIGGKDNKKFKPFVEFISDTKDKNDSL